MVEAAVRLARLPQLAKYEIVEEIGHGGMASVYRARDRRLGREVAVKVIHPHLRDSREVAERFHVEARAVAKLRHPNIVEIYDVADADEAEQYLVAELVRGTTLGRLRRERGAIPPEIAAALALEILEALAHAHTSGVVHRDVKPENVLIEHRPPPLEVDSAGAPAARTDRVAVKLTDFGIAKLLDAPGVTSTGQVLGSPAHMAPEQIEGGEVDARSDVFGLGVVLYDCVVGHLPFEGGNPAQVLRRVLEGDYSPAQRERPVVGARWSALIDRALAHEPANRFQSAREMRDAIVAEMDWVGFSSPRGELEAWFDDPDAYEKGHAKIIVDRLRARGDEARRRGDVLSAASDYNRALAQAPDDARLLQVVTGMHRAETRGRALRRGSIIVAVVLAAGAALRVSLRPSLLHPRALPAAHVQPAATGAAPFGSGGTNAPIPESSAHTVRAPVANPAPARAREAAGGKPTERSLTLDLRPPMGVSVSVDDKPGRPVTTGDGVTLDAEAHLLTFSCPVCTPLERSIAAGDKSETLHVDVPIKPATLLVEGSAADHYQIVQHPELHVDVGKNPIRLKSAYELVTVEQIETGAQRELRLEAGQAVAASFE
jgi:tRNA A-37 threonylcarbamoyl transferase component Bud32